MNIALLTIGDELLNGDLADTNTQTIARILTENGLTPREAGTIGDDEALIVTTLQRLAAAHKAVIVTGGLGPTEDDRTAKAAARAFGRPLSLNDQALQQIRNRFRTMRREMHPANEKQAMLPARSHVIPNPNGTAPGFSLQSDKAELFFLPGVPGEMQAMLEESVLPRLLECFPDRPDLCRRSLTVFGLPEPEVEGRLGAALLPDTVAVAFNVDFPMVRIKLQARGDHSQRHIDRAELQIRKALGDHIVAIDEETLAGNTARFLRRAGLTLALAESCTGGLIAKLLTDQAGASAFLERSVVTYANSAKTACLQVPVQLLEQHGAVSAETALAMAKGVRITAGTDIGLAVTGIAGPDGGTPEKPVGTVLIAMSDATGERVAPYHFPGNREQVRQRTACTALDWLRLTAMSRLGSSDRKD